MISIKFKRSFSKNPQKLYKTSARPEVLITTIALRDLTSLMHFSSKVNYQSLTFIPTI